MSAMDLPGYGRTSGGDEGGTSKRPRDLPRKATAVGLAGEVGASFTVYEKNWHCAECEAENTARRPKCWRCRAAKPEGGGGLVNEPAIEAAMVGREGTAWREAFDPATQHLYYYNGATQETSWERPAEMGPAPMATGWFGRGAVAAKALEYQAKIDGWLKRPAPKQKDKVEVDRGYTEGANEYNIWYGRHVGDNWRGEKLGKGDVSDTRCCVQVDAGKTRCTGDVFCIQFARGRCARGHECSYRHTIPSILDDATLPTMKDVFGRDRHATDKEDMGGAGNFMTNSRTVYVGGLRAAAAGEEARALESALWAQFGEWGEVENINVIHRLSIAFVRYRLRASTEFALVAMMNQGLLPTPAEAEGGGGGPPGAPAGPRASTAAGRTTTRTPPPSPPTSARTRTRWPRSCAQRVSPRPRRASPTPLPTTCRRRSACARRRMRASRARPRTRRRRRLLRGRTRGAAAEAVVVAVGRRRSRTLMGSMARPAVR